MSDFICPSPGSYKSIAAEYVCPPAAPGSWKVVASQWVGVAGGLWKQFYANFSPVTHTYTSGSGTDMIPTGAAQVVISVYGPGQQGGDGDPINGTNGGGGGAGGLAVKTMALSGSDWGNGLSYSVAGPGSNSASSGSVSSGSFALSGNTGVPGSPSGGSDGAGGPGGSASGGDSNTTGGAGGTGSSGGDAPPPDGGAGGGNGLGGFAPGGGGGGGTPTDSSGAGADGQVSFAYT